MKMLTGTAGALVLLVAAGCGSSGGDEPVSEAPKGIQTVEIGSISASATNEGEQVTVSIPVTNSTGSALKYDWTVTYGGQPLNFTGQDTNTIRFTAPEVNSNSVDRVIQS